MLSKTVSTNTRLHACISAHTHTHTHTHKHTHTHTHTHKPVIEINVLTEQYIVICSDMSYASLGCYKIMSVLKNRIHYYKTGLRTIYMNVSVGLQRTIIPLLKKIILK